MSADFHVEDPAKMLLPNSQWPSSNNVDMVMYVLQTCSAPSGNSSHPEGHLIKSLGVCSGVSTKNDMHVQKDNKESGVFSLE
jgi:hypothetical protein